MKLICPKRDIITIIWGIDLWGTIEYQENEMLFGDYPNAEVTKPSPGQSIAILGNCYTKDNSPTIGQVNDTTGAMGTLWGTIYDINLQPDPEETFYLRSGFTTSNDGEYFQRVPSSIFNRNSSKTNDA